MAAAKLASSPSKKADASLGDTTDAVFKWRDRIRKEMRNLSAHPSTATFVVNPRKLSALAPKIGEVDSASGDPSRQADVTMLKGMLATAALPPQEKARRPAVSSQEVGWYWKGEPVWDGWVASESVSAATASSL